MPPGWTRWCTEEESYRLRLSNSPRSLALFQCWVTDHSLTPTSLLMVALSTEDIPRLLAKSVMETIVRSCDGLRTD